MWVEDAAVYIYIYSILNIYAKCIHFFFLSGGGDVGRGCGPGLAVQIQQTGTAR